MKMIDNDDDEDKKVNKIVEYSLTLYVCLMWMHSEKCKSIEWGK